MGEVVGMADEHIIATPAGFGRFIRRERVARGWHMRQLTERMRTRYNAYGNLYRLEKGQCKQGPTLVTLVDILNALGYELRIVRKDKPTSQAGYKPGGR